MTTKRIRPNIGRVSLAVAAGMLFVFMGLCLLSMPPMQPHREYWRWPASLLSIALGGGVIVFFLFFAMRPIVDLSPTHLHDFRHHLTIPWHDIRSGEAFFWYRGQSTRLILLRMHDRDKYLKYDGFSKRFDPALGDDYVSIPLVLASMKDFNLVCEWIERMTGQPVIVHDRPRAQPAPRPEDLPS